jgi:hypothetical protein
MNLEFSRSYISENLSAESYVGIQSVIQFSSLTVEPNSRFKSNSTEVLVC